MEGEFPLLWENNLFLGAIKQRRSMKKRLREILEKKEGEMMEER
jgi:hypothetical protein